MANYTRFNGLSATIDGYSVGAVGSEVAVITGTATTTVTIVANNATITSATVTSLNATNILSGVQTSIDTFFTTASSAQANYVIAPFAGNITAVYVCSDTSARAAAYTVTHGSAGNVAATATNTSGIAGLVTALTLGTVACTAGESLSVARGVQGSTGAGYVTIVLQRTS